MQSAPDVPGNKILALSAIRSCASSEERQDCSNSLNSPSNVDSRLSLVVSRYSSSYFTTSAVNSTVLRMEMKLTPSRRTSEATISSSTFVSLCLATHSAREPVSNKKTKTTATSKDK